MIILCLGLWLRQMLLGCTIGYRMPAGRNMCFLLSTICHSNPDRTTSVRYTSAVPKLRKQVLVWFFSNDCNKRYVGSGCLMHYAIWAEIALLQVATHKLGCLQLAVDRILQASFMTGDHQGRSCVYTALLLLLLHLRAQGLCQKPFSVIPDEKLLLPPGERMEAYHLCNLRQFRQSLVAVPQCAVAALANVECRQDVLSTTFPRASSAVASLRLQLAYATCMHV